MAPPPEGGIRFWDAVSLERTLLFGIIVYVAAIVFLRLTGNQTLPKRNAFDWVLTVAMGSVVADVLLSPSVSLVTGVTALAMLIFLQVGVGKLVQTSHWFERIVKSEPALLFHHGQFLDQALRGERVSHDEVLASIRQAGYADLDKVRAVVLETDGSMSVIGEDPPRSDRATLVDVKGADDEWPTA